MIQDGVTAGLFPKDPLEDRLEAVISTATSTYLAALDEAEQEVATLFLQRAAQAADEAWQHTMQRQQGPSALRPTIAIAALTLAMRQLGVGAQGSAEAPAARVITRLVIHACSWSSDADDELDQHVHKRCVHQHGSNVCLTTPA